MKRLVAVGWLIALLFFFAWSARPRPLEFAPSFDAALASAREQGDWIVVHVRRPDRPLGAKMDAEVLPARAVAAEAHDGFVHVRVDAAREAELATRLAGPGAALATVVTDERGDVVALLPGFVAARPLVAHLDHVRSHRPDFEAARRRLDADAADVAARLDLVQLLQELGATTRAEAEVERARRELAAAAAGATAPGSAAAEAPRALALHAELLSARGQDAAAAEVRRELVARYPASPFALKLANSPRPPSKEE